MQLYTHAHIQILYLDPATNVHKLLRTAIEVILCKFVMGPNLASDSIILVREIASFNIISSIAIFPNPNSFNVFKTNLNNL